MEGKAETVQTSHLLRRSDTGIHRLSPQFLESRSNPSSMLLHLLIIAFIRSADKEYPTPPSQLLLLVSFLLTSGAACGHVSHIIDQSSVLHYYISILSHWSSAQQKCLFFSPFFRSYFFFPSHWFFEIRFNSFFFILFSTTSMKMSRLLELIQRDSVSNCGTQKCCISCVNDLITVIQSCSHIHPCFEYK